MNNQEILAGLDLGHLYTKAVIMRGQEILGFATVPTGFEVVSAAEESLQKTLGSAGVLRENLKGVIATGIFRNRIKGVLNVRSTFPDDVAEAKGALFLQKNSRTLIVLGGNIQKVIRYDPDGNLVDVIQNDKCAEGLGLFYTTMARAFGVREVELSELALKSTKHVSLAIHCATSAESEMIDLLCQGVEISDVADALLRFIGERVSAMCLSIPLEPEIVVAGGLAKSKALIKHLSVLLKKDIGVLTLPEYVGAVGAVISHRSGE